ncbi:MAG: nuclear transport factor 2 family protein [Actinomycetota bacterium]|nr:nuclear transport factor 2 family protein [Actinomycetota bacterium]
MCAAVDRGDADSFASFFAEGAVYRFGNAEPTNGREAVVAATTGATTALPWVRHTVEQVAEVGDQLFCRFLIETAAPDGGPVALPCVTVIEMDGDEIIDYRVHMDLAPALG